MRTISTLVIALFGLGLMAAAVPAATQQPNSTAQSIQTAGYNAGFRDGVADYRQHAPYSLSSHPAYQNGAEGYNPSLGVSQATYQADFRNGYTAGYKDGFYGITRPAQAAAQPAAPAAQNRAPRAAAATPNELPAGTKLQLTLNNALSTRTSNPGDTFTATVAAPVYSTDGSAVLVPQGSTVAGKVEQVQRSGGVSGNSRIQLAFTDLHLTNGQTLPLRAELSSVNAAQGVGGAITGTPSATNEGGVQRSQTRNTVGTAAAGGAVGALIGAIAGGGKGAGLGGLAGAGLGVFLASRNGALDLKAGTPITITLSQPVRLR
jgi:hypothetical protein